MATKEQVHKLITELDEWRMNRERKNLPSRALKKASSYLGDYLKSLEEPMIVVVPGELTCPVPRNGLFDKDYFHKIVKHLGIFLRSQQCEYIRLYSTYNTLRIKIYHPAEPARALVLTRRFLEKQEGVGMRKGYTGRSVHGAAHVTVYLERTGS